MKNQYIDKIYLSTGAQIDVSRLEALTGADAAALSKIYYQSSTTPLMNALAHSDALAINEDVTPVFQNLFANDTVSGTTALSHTVTAIAFDTDTSVPVAVVSASGTLIETKFGTLLVKADGNYQFTPNANANALAQGDAETLNFTYTTQYGSTTQTSKLNSTHSTIPVQYIEA